MEAMAFARQFVVTLRRSEHADANSFRNARALEGRKPRRDSRDAVPARGSSGVLSSTMRVTETAGGWNRQDFER